MSEIDGIIGSQAFELVRDRIGAILAVELENQATISGNYDLDADVFVERWLPVDNSEVPVVNVTMIQGTYDNKHQGNSRGTYRYSIDCYTGSVSSEDARGDVSAMFKLHRLIGVCRAVLENPVYKHLGFTPSFVSHTMVNGVSIAEPNRQDALYNVMGRLTFEVQVVETTALLNGDYAGGIDTQVKLYLTDKGYMYVSE